MSTDSLTLQELAKLLNRDARTLEKQAEQGKLPGRRVAGTWKFHRSDVQDWLEMQFGVLSDRQLEDVERGITGRPLDQSSLPMLVTHMMSVETSAVPLDARTARGVLQKLVEVANGNWHVYMPDKIYTAIREREELCSTALPGGVAIPHPRRPSADALGDNVIAFGKTTTGIPFGGVGNTLCDLFFLILCRDDQTHLQVLSRLARMFLREGFLDNLRSCESSAEVLELIGKVEAEIIGEAV